MKQLNALKSLFTIVVLSCVVLLSSCEKEDDEEKESVQASSIELVSGDRQSQLAGVELDEPIIVLVKDQNGAVVSNAEVNFSIERGAVSSEKVSTGPDGKASVVWTLGESIGEQELIITAFMSDGITYLSGSPISVPATSIIPVVTDIQGSSYHLVKIGNQIWTASSLRTTMYPDHTLIPHIEDAAEWANLGDNNTDKAYCYYENDVTLDYALLYTWAAATNGVNYTTIPVQGICPTGWHLPNDDEWNELAEFLGGENTAGGSMKEAGIDHWISPNEGATNSSGFNALPGGSRDFNADGMYENGGNQGSFWSSTQNDEDEAWYRNLNNEGTDVKRWNFFKSSGFSVRCIKN